MGKEERYFMGIDVGTYESKGVLIDKDCRILCQASQKHGLENPRPGWYEHDAEAVWWGDVCKISRLLLERSRLDPAQIECVGLSALDGLGMGAAATFVLVCSNIVISLLRR